MLLLVVVVDCIGVTPTTDKQPKAQKQAPVFLRYCENGGQYSFLEI